MESSLAPLLPLYERERAAGRAAALAVVLDTAGSTYRKPGALMLIASTGEYAGLLSGGCLEGDLREHARAVIDSGEPRTVSYDMRGPDDLLWGLGVGCEGAMQILLLRVGPANDWQPLAHLVAAHAAQSPTAIALVVEPARSDERRGAVVLPDGTDERSVALRSLLESAARSGRAPWMEDVAAVGRVFVLPLALPPRLLLLGAGPDTLPIVDFAARLGWKVVLVDHRPAYAQRERFPLAERVVLSRPDELTSHLDPAEFDAAVVMSHHLASDLEYLRALAKRGPRYVGLLGPAHRRERLLTDLGELAEVLRPRLRAPVGLALGGRAPESIALAIVAEIHAFLHGLEGRPFSSTSA
ncbi:MAG: XdhC family protein [Pseudomonadota bacterium]|nr:MAG: xanthine dehydrogenase [Pseudomonadota bacterium]